MSSISVFRFFSAVLILLLSSMVTLAFWNDGGLPGPPIPTCNATIPWPYICIAEIPCEIHNNDEHSCEHLIAQENFIPLLNYACGPTVIPYSNDNFCGLSAVESACWGSYECNYQLATEECTPDGETTEIHHEKQTVSKACTPVP